uniref:Uncharacterized protein n=1 Tax=Arundo donax TaxID=35708 RepID=A0A0A9G5W5_ARUDO
MKVMYYSKGTEQVYS